MSQARAVVIRTLVRYDDRMRTLQSQMRLRRLLRAEADFRLRRPAAPEPELLEAARRRLLGLAADLRSTWAKESAAGWVPAPLGRYVARSLTGIEVALAALDRPGADLGGLEAEFQEAALPLLLCLRGLEDLGSSPLGELLAPELLRSA